MLRVGLALIATLISFGAPAQAPYPNQPVRMIVPFAPGGASDFVARVMQHKFGEILGQQIVIENKGGAAGNIGMDAAARANPDGYTLFLGNIGTVELNPYVFKDLKLKPLQDLIAISQLADMPSLLIVNKDFPPNTVQELIDYVKTRPGKINFASPGYGTPPHMIGEMFKQRASVDIVHVPYKGTAAALTDIMAGQVQLTFENPSVLVQLIRDGKLKGLATTGEVRNPQAPELPTMIESGLADFVSTSFTALAAPAGTPPEIVRRLNAELNAGLNSTELGSTFAKLGVGSRPLSPEEFGAFLVHENQKWSAVARTANIRIE